MAPDGAGQTRAWLDDTTSTPTDRLPDITMHGDGNRGGGGGGKRERERTRERTREDERENEREDMASYFECESQVRSINTRQGGWNLLLCRFFFSLSSHCLEPVHRWFIWQQERFLKGDNPGRVRWSWDAGFGKALGWDYWEVRNNRWDVLEL